MRFAAIRRGENAIQTFQSCPLYNVTAVVFQISDSYEILYILQVMQRQSILNERKRKGKATRGARVLFRQTQYRYTVGFQSVLPNISNSFARWQRNIRFQTVQVLPTWLVPPNLRRPITVSVIVLQTLIFHLYYQCFTNYDGI